MSVKALPLVRKKKRGNNDFGGASNFRAILNNWVFLPEGRKILEVNP